MRVAESMRMRDGVHILQFGAGLSVSMGSECKCECGRASIVYGGVLSVCLSLCICALTHVSMVNK